MIEDFHSSQWFIGCSSWLRLLCATYTGAISLFGVQKVLQKRLPYALQWNLLVSIGGETVDECVQRPSNENTVFLSDAYLFFFFLSGIVSGELCSDSLGNTEMYRPVDVPRNRKSAWQITAAGSVDVWLQTCLLQPKVDALMSCYVLQRPKQKNRKEQQRQNMETLWNKHLFVIILLNYEMRFVCNSSFFCIY